MRSQTLPLAPELMTRVVGAGEGRIISTDLIRRAATGGDSRPHFGVLRRRLYEGAEAELYFFCRLFGIEPADEIEPVDIENL